MFRVQAANQISLHEQLLQSRMVEHLEDRLAIHHFGKVVFGLDEVGVAEAGVVEVVADAGDQACELFEVGEHFAEEG